MGKIMDMIPMSDLTQDAAKIMRHLRNSNEPLIITQQGRETAVIFGIEAYKQFEREKELLRLLAKGDKEMELGEGYDLNSVLAEADALLDQEPT